MTPRVLVIGDKKSMVATAAALGAEVWWVQHPAEFPPGEAGDADLTLLADYTGAGFVELIADLHRGKPFDAVVAIAENAQLAAAALNDRFGLRGPSLAAVRLLTDKPAMRAHLAALGVSPVAAALGAGAEDLREFGATHGFPFVAKPVAATGSFGVTLVDGPERVGEVHDWFAGIGSDVFLMEEYLDGPEVSVESFSFDGRHVVLTLTDKLVGADFIEAGHTVPAAADERTSGVGELVGEFLDAVGLTDGPTHVEVKLTSRGPRVVEGHSRRGGDRINDLVRLAYGLDMEEMTVAWAMGRLAPLTASPVAKGGAAIRFASAEQGEVVAIAGPAQVRAEPDVVELGVTRAVGDRIDSVRWSLDRPGFVIATGDTGAAAAATAAANAARIVFTVRPLREPADEGSRTRALSRQLDQAERIGYQRAGALPSAM